MNGPQVDDCNFTLQPPLKKKFQQNFIDFLDESQTPDPFPVDIRFNFWAGE